MGVLSRWTIRRWKSGDEVPEEPDPIRSPPVRALCLPSRRAGEGRQEPQLCECFQESDTDECKGCRLDHKAATDRNRRRTTCYHFATELGSTVRYLPARLTRLAARNPSKTRRSRHRKKQGETVENELQNRCSTAELFRRRPNSYQRCCFPTRSQLTKSEAGNFA